MNSLLPTSMIYDDLHQALQAVVQSQIARTAPASWAKEYVFIQLLCARTRQLQYRGHNRAEIVHLLLAEMEGPGVGEEGMTHPPFERQLASETGSDPGPTPCKVCCCRGRDSGVERILTTLIHLLDGLRERLAR